jgi:diguanylate cyclase (GGDEF)-like protein/PAS domain S-box-containing protein
MINNKAACLRVCVGLTVAALTAIASYFDWFGRIDLLIYDWRIAQNVREPSDEVVIVAVDEQSLAALGQWAWPRSVHARLVRRLIDAGARTIAFDIAFVDPDPRDPMGDALLAQAMTDHGGVVLPVLHEELPLSGQIIETMPSVPLTQAAAALAHVDIEYDRDGVVRRIFLKAGVATPFWPALALAAVQLDKPGTLSRVPAIRAERKGPVSPLEWVRDEMILIPYVGPPGHLSRVSYIDVLDGKFEEHRFRDRVVLVGVTAAGLGERFIVPFDRPNQAMTGVELQANVVDALLREIFLRPLDSSWVAALACGITVLAVALYELFRPRWIILVGALAMVALVNFVAMAAAGLWIPPATAFVSLILSFAFQASLRHSAVRRMLVRERDRASAGLKSIADGVIATDASGTVTLMNAAAEQLTGFRLSEARGQPLDTILRLHDAETGAPIDPKGLAGNGTSVASTTWDAVLNNRTGRTHDIRGTVARLDERTSRIGGLVVAINDVTDVRQLARSIGFQATHDAVTELPNRKLFEQALDHAIARAIRDHGSLAIFVVDIDRFSNISDTLGREAANAVLRVASARLASSVRDSDMVARIGEDRFGVFVTEVAHRDSVTFLSHKVKKALAKPFDIGGFEQLVSVSIGVGFFPRDADDSHSLITAAERALGRAKQLGGSRIQYAAEAARVTDFKRAGIRRTLRQAIERDEMSLHYQPQLASDRGNVIGVEALLRWSSSDGRLNAPPDVIAVAEELGLANQINTWVVATACREARSAWEAAGLQALRVSVNLTAEQFLDPNLPAMIQERLASVDRNTVRLALEITEGTLIRDMDVARRNMERIRKLDVDIFVDDFGVGYASLVYLKRLPLTGLKIDKSCVQDALLDPQDAAIVRAIIVLAHSMGLQVVAEGVETRKQLDFLRSENCDEVQGYFISHPLPTHGLVSWLKSTPHIPLS